MVGAIDGTRIGHRCSLIAMPPMMDCRSEGPPAATTVSLPVANDASSVTRRSRQQPKRTRPRSPRWLVKIRASAWRTTISVGAIIAIVSLIINVCLAAISSTHPRDPINNNPVLQEGPCASMRPLFFWSHLCINVLSTLLLASSNYTMQCLSAPTREELDVVHSRGEWLEIGLSGVLNWKVMTHWRRCLWVLLAVSSLPLHLFYNSVIYLSTSANEYNGMLVDQTFLRGGSMDESLFSNATLAEEEQAQAGQLTVTSNADCIRAYQSADLGTYSNVILVSKTAQFPNFTRGSVALAWSQSPTATSATFAAGGSYNWLCKQDSTADALTAGCVARSIDPSQWTYTLCEAGGTVYPGGPPGNPGASNYNNVWLSHPSQCDSQIDVEIDHCLAFQRPQNCSLQTSTGLIMVIVTLNALKVVFFLLAVYWRHFEPLVTLGDALASYLTRPDTVTRGLGVISAAEIRARRKDHAIQAGHALSAEMRNMTGFNHRGKFDETFRQRQQASVLDRDVAPEIHGSRLWLHGASQRRWLITYGLWVVVFAASLGVLFRSYVLADPSARDSFAKIWADGFGSYSSHSTITATQGASVTSNVLFSNLPQLLLSLAYFATNGLLTCIELSREFGRFAFRRAGLRVTWPRGDQRSTFWLSLPYRYSMPLLVVSALTHWVMSQSLYLVQVVLYTPSDARDDANSISCLGWSALALTIIVIFATLMLTALAAMGLRGRFPAGIPLVESNSLAISAACHPPMNESSAGTRSTTRADGAQDATKPKLDPLTREFAEDDEATRRLKYGAFGRDRWGTQRVALTSREVQQLVIGDDYE